MISRVLHLVGSAVDDFHVELSLTYARDCLASVADPARWEMVVALVLPDGTWRFPDDLSPGAIDAAPALGVADAIARLVSLDVDVAVPQMFCRPGMTRYRALLDVLGIPYVGNDATTMALTADKWAARALVAASGVPVPEGELVTPGRRPHLAPPVVVKPVDADNSHGVSLVTRGDDLAPALDAAFAHAPRAVVERFVPLGREVRCATIETDRGVICLPLEEYDVDPVTKPIRDAADKLRRGEDGSVGLVAKDGVRARVVDPTDPVNAAVRRTALACHEALGCRHYGLFDLRVDPDGRPWFLEASLYCSFATTSVVVTMARAAGITLDELFASMLDRAAPGTGGPRSRGGGS